MWIIKLGGSLLNTSQLLPWLQTIQQCKLDNICVVPGGGVFADSVRSIQTNYQFSDQTAHQMALLAMAQYGSLCQSLCSGYKIVHCIEELHLVVQQGKRAIMNPYQWPGIDRLEASWSVTSDTIACWLASEVKADTLVLIKSVAEIPRYQNFQQLHNNQLVDAAFPKYASGLTCPIHVLAQASQTEFINLISC